MSRIGKKSIELPKGVSVTISNSNVVTVKGPNGELSEAISQDMKISVENGSLTIARPTEQKRHRSLHGLYRTLINNMVVGVSQGYKKELELIGVGYKAESSGRELKLSLGYSHPILMILPKEVKVEAESPRGKNPSIKLSSIDKQLLGQVAAKIRSLRPPEPYKGKGIKYKGEVILRKAGKAAGKK